MSYGSNPWQQTQWDWRAAGNFIGGGAGSGLIMVTALLGVHGAAAAILLLAGLALIGIGLACVWAELGRPLRAMNVFFNARTSWMTRESFAATLLMPLGLAAAYGACTGAANVVWLAGLLAFAFIYCQSRMLQGARGIVAWREPLSVQLLLATSLAEGAGLLLLALPLHGNAWAVPLAIVLVLARAGIWLLYRQRLAGRLAPRARAALDRAGRVLLIGGTLLPLLLIAASFAVAGPVFSALAGLLAMLAGSIMKFVLVTRAGYNQGFALEKVPVRGGRWTAG
jgi:phenylacetyl-CoA:acceptor oxidoreductase subunit 2